MRHATAWAAKLLLMLAAACSGHKGAPAVPNAVLPTPRGNFSLQLFAPQGEAKGLVLFGSGDGGWSYFEDKVVRALADNGYAVVGWDCRNYADLGAYDQRRVAADARAALEKGRAFFRCGDRPVILGGWSTGAEQMVAVAASADRPPGVRGLLLLSPGERGRYGITVTDLLGVTPRGPDTFALADMGKSLVGLKLVQFHGEDDDLDQTAWLGGLAVPCKLEVYPKAGHNFDGAAPAFLERLSRAAEWLIHG